MKKFEEYIHIRLILIMKLCFLHLEINILYNLHAFFSSGTPDTSSSSSSADSSFKSMSDSNLLVSSSASKSRSFFFLFFFLSRNYILIYDLNLQNLKSSMINLLFAGPSSLLFNLFWAFTSSWVTKCTPLVCVLVFVCFSEIRTPIY